MLLVYIHNAGIRKTLSANALHTCGRQAAGLGFGRVRSVCSLFCTGSTSQPEI